LRAQVPWMCQMRFVRSYSPRPSHTSIGVIAPLCISMRVTKVNISIW
jgi:hypothetical protein